MQVEVPKVYSLNNLQKKIADICISNLNSAFYITQIKVELNCELNVENWGKAYEEAIASFPYLSGALTSIDSKKFIVESNSVEFFCNFLDLSRFSEKMQKEKIYNFIEQDYKKPFDLYRAPLFRAHLVKVKYNCYFFLFTHHHILLDYHSFSAIVTAMLENYKNIGRKLPNCVQFKGPLDLKKIYSRSEIKKTEKYWKRQVDQLEELVALPGRAHYQPQISDSSFLFDFSKNISFGVNQICQKHKMSPSVIFYAAWAILLSRYGFSDKISFGIVRRYPKLLTQNRVGLLVDTFPLILSLRKNNTMLKFCKKINERIHEMKGYPCFVLKETFLKEKTCQIFDCLVDYKGETFLEMLREKFGKIIQAASFRNTTEMPLCLEIWKTKHGFSAKLSFNREQFHEACLRSLPNVLFKIIEYMCNHPAQRISTLSLFSYPAVLKPVSAAKLYKINKKNFPLIEAFYKSVKTYPDKMAVLCEKQSLTYSRLAEEIDHLVDNFSHCGIQQKIVVAICLSRSINWIISSIAVVKYNCTSVSLDYLHPKFRLKNIIEQSRAKLIIVESSTISICDDMGIPLLNIDHLRKHKKLFSLPRRSFAFGKAQNSHIIFTSGSTGEPKGVYLTQQGVYSTAAALTREIQLNNKEKFLAVASMSFDMAVMDVWLPLILGSTLVLATDEQQRFPEKIVELMTRHKITCMEATPAFWQALIDVGLKKKKHKIKILSGGEVLTSSLATSLINIGELYNLYGPTENSIYSTIDKISNPKNITIGKPLSNTRVYIIDKFGHLAPPFVKGELYLSGEGLSPGYLNNILNKRKFVMLPSVGKQLLYKTNDLGCLREDGRIIFLGREDNQIKRYGYRIELDEIVHVLESHEEIRKALVCAYDVPNAYNKALIAYIFPKSFDNLIYLKKSIIAYLVNRLPYYMMPSKVDFIRQLPVTVHGKTDYSRLKEYLLLNDDYEVGETKEGIITKLTNIWKNVLSLSNFFGKNENFFELGGNSILAALLLRNIHADFNITDINIVDLYRYPTLGQQIKLINSFMSDCVPQTKHNHNPVCIKQEKEKEIAIIGFACRFPEANTPDEFWQNLINNKIVFTKQKRSCQEDIKGLVSVSGVYKDVYLFDNKFFGYSSAEAEQIDPQQRVFLEICWEALENAGYPAQLEKANSIGIFAGGGESSYSFHGNSSSPYIDFNKIKQQINFSPDYLATRVAYKLNLGGPAIALNTACSTSLVAVIKACQSILLDECDMALAGGISLIMPSHAGYVASPGSIFSPKGKCKVFDQQSDGTVPSSGGGVVVLKSLHQAMTDNDCIYGIIKGFAINNDGLNKASFAAPSVEGQIKCLSKALQMSGLSSDQISYIETHGTGTLVGDPIECTALQQVYGVGTQRKIAIGALKANIGHTNHASGIAGLLKILLMIQNKKIPKQVSYSVPNPACNLKNSNFYIPQTNCEWKEIQQIAAVSSFGVGGTNAHLILSNHISPKRRLAKSYSHIFPVSAKTKESLRGNIQKLLNFLVALRSKDNYIYDVYTLSNIAYTLQTGRQHFLYRWVAIAKNIEDLIRKLKTACLEEGILDGQADRRLVRLARRWISGNTVEWNKLYKRSIHKPHKVLLPTYAWKHKYFNRQNELLKENENFLPGVFSDGSAVVKILVSVWKEIFGDISVNKDSNFFDLGGDSLMAIEFIQRLSKKYQITISPFILEKYPTIFQLSNYMVCKNHEDKLPEFISCIRDRGAKNNIFLLHPVGGTTYCYAQLADLISSEFNVYVINDPDINCEKVTYGSLRELAQLYAEKIQEIQPCGPYHISGLSLGGIVSREIAAIIYKTGGALGFVGLIEGWAKTPSAFVDINIFSNITKKQSYGSFENLKSKKLDIDFKFALNIAHSRMMQLLEHKQSVVEFPVILFKARETNDYFMSIEDSYNHWKSCSVGEIVKYECEGSHETILCGDNGTKLANLINKHLLEWV